MQSNENIITQTKNWIVQVVVGCNFCPFAAREIKRNSIYYKVQRSEMVEEVLTSVSYLFAKMDEDENVETSFLILPFGFELFLDYLSIVDEAENLLTNKNYEGVYQIASFHPQYLFAGSNEKDASNYTNRSPHPMLHILREDSLSKAIDAHPNVDSIPQTNIDFTQAKGLSWMQNLFDTATKL